MRQAFWPGAPVLAGSGLAILVVACGILYADRVRAARPSPCVAEVTVLGARGGPTVTACRADAHISSVLSGPDGLFAVLCICDRVVEDSEGADAWAPSSGAPNWRESGPPS